ncbi:MAG: DUF4417 domain-containing protein [Atopobiaceae bacterium]|nr:DUF4417 domain-containing protein [Atopobiaceae bacterium]
MVEGATFCCDDIPLCPTTATSPPRDMITWEEAEAIYDQHMATGDAGFHHDAFVCFFLDDWKFDGKNGIWFGYRNAERILSHFDGVVTPDFSTNQDFPKPWKVFNTYRMRAFGYWLGRLGHQVINNVRWGTPETYSYCFEGIPRRSVVCIGTVASGLKLVRNRPLFEEGLGEMLRVLKPHTVIVYGSANYPPLRMLDEAGIHVVQFDSATNRRFSKDGGADE